MLFITDESGAIQRLSGPLARLFGPDARGAALAAFVHPEDRGAFDAMWTRLRGSAEPAQIDCRLRGSDGSYRAYACVAQRPAEHGEVHGSLNEQAAGAAERALRDKAFRMVLSNTPLMLWAIDLQGVFTLHEGKGIADVGIKPGHFLGANIFEIYADYPEGVEPVRRALAGDIVHSITAARGLDTENWQMPLRDERGAITACVGLTLDIWPAKRVERELRAKVEQIEEQKEIIRALSTPILEVWDKVLTLPLVGAVDSERVGDVMNSLLHEVVRKRARFAILDLTGVEVVDSGTAGHLINLVRSLRLLGTEGVITGIQPVVAETMVTLGLSLEGIVTSANLRQGLDYCINRMETDPE